jgi:hypothetical protein
MAEVATAPQPVRLEIREGALTELPVVNDRILWESHARGKNWMATIARDPTAPNGLARTFLAKARGDYFYLCPPGTLAVGDAVEIGADYYTAGGNATRRRWYGHVAAVAAGWIDLVPAPSAAAAIDAGATAKADPTAPPGPLAATPDAELVAELEARGYAVTLTR